MNDECPCWVGHGDCGGCSGYPGIAHEPACGWELDPRCRVHNCHRCSHYAHNDRECGALDIETTLPGPSAWPVSELVGVCRCPALRRGDVVEAVLWPRRMDDLAPGIPEVVGQTFTWTAEWVIEDGPYEGQLQMRLKSEDRLPGFSWASECDLANIVKIGVDELFTI